jgi:hypothetical protein
VSRARLESAPARTRARTAPPAVLTDNLNGRSFDARAVAREVGFVLGPEILKRLQRRNAS